MRESFFVHTCDLSFEERHSTQPSRRRVNHWWERFDYYKTVYKDEDTLRYFRSQRAYYREVHRHLSTKQYRFTIHPFSFISFYLDFMMAVVWTGLMITGPIQASFVFKSYHFGHGKLTNWLVLMYFLRVCRVLATIDIFLRFFRGYVVTRTQEIVLDLKQIRSHYLKTYFFFDLMVPVLWIIVKLVPKTEGGIRVKMIVHQLNYVLLSRFGTWLAVWDRMWRKLRFGEPFRVCFGLTLAALLMMHYWSCTIKLLTVLYEMIRLDKLPDSWYSKYKREMEVFELGNDSPDGEVMRVIRDYFVHFSIVSCYFLGVEMGRYYTEDPLEMLIFSWILITGVIFYIWAVARIIQFFGEMDVSRRLYEELIHQSTNHMISNRYPQRLRHRILKYYDYKYNRSFFDEEGIMGGLSEHLRMEVVLYSSLHLIQNLKIFRGLSKATIGSILPFLRLEIFLANDTVMRVHDEEKRFFFIVYGTCSIQLMDNTEMTHCEDGDLVSNAWNDITGRDSISFLYKIVAAEPCQVFTMELSDLRYCCTRYPGLLERFNLIVSKGTVYFNELFAIAMARKEDLKHSDILYQLRRKKILIQGNRRVDLL